MNKKIYSKEMSHRIEYLIVNDFQVVDDKKYILDTTNNLAYYSWRLVNVLKGVFAKYEQ
ncbi:hypothetical protein [Lactobacillus terrae]|uniref:hypothetical protein n=1 Tax=Lactobacillus terrae TaxID=2269374 RepID=UPI0014756170|nr:hypothetical protein [Lactobacillus terrae]